MSARLAKLALIIIPSFLLIILLFRTIDFSNHLQSYRKALSTIGTFQEERKVVKTENYLINKTERFQWYRMKRNHYFKYTLFTHSEIKTVSILNAYEFDFEYVVTHTTPFIMGATLFCRYYDEQNVEIGSAIESFSFPDWTVYCPKMVGARKISLSIEKNSIATIPIPLLNRMTEPTYQLSMCMAPMYGPEPKWLLLTELIEHYKLQGVDHFYFYVSHISEYDSYLIQDYVRTGEVEVVYLLDRYKRDDHGWPSIALADCLVRSRSQSEWSIFSDLDERLMMTNYTGTLLDYLKFSRKTNPNIGAIQFRQQWILKTETMPQVYTGEQQVMEWMPTLRWHNSSAYGPPSHTVKCIVDPKSVFYPWTHFPKIMMPGYRIKELTPDVGIVRHYRDQQMWNWGVKWLKTVLKFGPLRMTDYPEKYQQQLTNAVLDRTRYVYENFQFKSRR